MLLRPLFFTSFLIDDQLADEGLTERGPIADLQRLEQDRDRRRLPAGAARGGRAGRAHLAAQRRVRRGPGDLRPHRHLRRDRLARARAGHLRRHRRRRRGAPRGPLALRRRARPQHGRGGHPLGGARRRRRASCPGRRRPSSSPPTGSSSAPRTGAAAGLEQRVAEAWHPFCEWTGGWLEMIRGQGFEAVQSAYLDVLEGRVDPKTAPRALARLTRGPRPLGPSSRRCPRKAMTSFSAAATISLWVMPGYFL